MIVLKLVVPITSNLTTKRLRADHPFEPHQKDCLTAFHY